MKLFNRMFLLGVIGLLFFGCAKKSGIEGKVVDGKGAPMAGVRITAKQVQPIKGYEYFETKTNSDGSFSLKGVYPASDYVLEVYKIGRTIVKSAPKGQTSMLPSPIEVRFVILEDGIITDSITGRRWTQKDGSITDSKTGLQWAQDAGGQDGQEMTWHQANNYVRTLKIGGYSDWRLPSKEELESLADYAERLKDINDRWSYEVLGFKNVASDVYWSSSTHAHNTDFARIIDMYRGDVYSASNKSNSYYVWPVRAGQ